MGKEEGSDVIAVNSTDDSTRAYALSLGYVWLCKDLSLLRLANCIQPCGLG